MTRYSNGRAAPSTCSASHAPTRSRSIPSTVSVPMAGPYAPQGDDVRRALPRLRRPRAGDLRRRPPGRSGGKPARGEERQAALRAARRSVDERDPPAALVLARLDVDGEVD